ncbi:hypothetical protein F8S13_27015 [Chloroflexia bacterium SDU3-3]|nr:hypothetical protein F8S13_27015 [Chloroflexia bacterium SDU3-3]
MITKETSTRSPLHAVKTTSSYTKPAQPGEVLFQDVLNLGHIQGIGQAFLHIVVDKYSHHTFGLIDTDGNSETAVALLKDYVLPFYQKKALSIGFIFTDKSMIFQDSNANYYHIYLHKNSIKHEYRDSTPLLANTPIERLTHIISRNFISFISSFPPYITVEQLQQDWSNWLNTYNIGNLREGKR